MNAISTYKTFFMKGSTSGNSTTWSKLIDIKSFPDLGGAPEMLDKTTMSDPAKTYIPGLRDQSALEFETNYNLTDYTTLAALKGVENDYAIWFGATVSDGVATPTGTDGKYKFKGYLDVYINGGGVNEVVNMTVVIAPSTPITLDTAA